MVGLSVQGFAHDCVGSTIKQSGIDGDSKVRIFEARGSKNLGCKLSVDAFH